MKTSIAAVCVLFALSAVTAFAEENGTATHANSAQPTQQATDQKAEAAKKYKKQTDEKKAPGQDGQQGATTGTESNAQQK